MNLSRPTISIIVPLHNEAGSLLELHSEINKVAQTNNYHLEILFVDDGSTDNSWSVIKQIARKESSVKGIRLGNNFGKAAAISAGVNHAQGQLIVTLDADLQDNPEDIPKFINKINQGFDIVSGWRKTRHDPWHKIWASFIFNFLVRITTNSTLHDINCGMKCCRRNIFNEVFLYGELHRFLPILAESRGSKTGEVIVNHRPRKHGHSKYGLRRFIKGFFDLITVKFLTKYGQRPQHVFGSIGTVLLLISIILLGLLATSFAAPDISFLNPPTIFLLSIILFLTSLHLFSIGLLAEMMAAHHRQNTSPYSIAEYQNIRSTRPPTKLN